MNRLRKLPLDGLEYLEGPFCVVFDGQELTWESFEALYPDLTWCELCRRVYPETVSFVGAPVDCCVHCDYEQLHKMAGVEPELSEALEDDTQRHPGGLARYVRDYAPTHDTAACQHRPHCFLCDACASSGPLKTLQQIRSWLAARGFGPRSPEATVPPERRRQLLRRPFQSWATLSESEQRAALDALCLDVRLPLEAGRSRSGQPALLSRDMELEFVVVPGKGAVAAFLLCTTALSGRHAVALGAVASTPEPDLPWTGFNLEHLSPLWRWDLRLPREAEWLVASESSSGSLERFVCGGGSPALVLRPDAPINALGLRDLAGQVAELIDVQSAEVVTAGGSAMTPRDRVEPLSHPAPRKKVEQQVRALVEHHPIRPLGGLLPSLVPSWVGLRPAIGI